jgi:type II secretory pathway component PulF
MKHARQGIRAASQSAKLESIWQRLADMVVGSGDSDRRNRRAAAYPIAVFGADRDGE